MASSEEGKRKNGSSPLPQAKAFYSLKDRMFFTYDGETGELYKDKSLKKMWKIANELRDKNGYAWEPEGKSY